MAEFAAHFNNGVVLGQGFPHDAHINPTERCELGWICLPL